MHLPESRSRVGWWALALTLLVSLLFVAYSIIGTLVLGLFIYYVSRPIYHRVAGRWIRGISTPEGRSSWWHCQHWCWSGTRSRSGSENTARSPEPESRRITPDSSSV